jgi:hypothetical protein
MDGVAYQSGKLHRAACARARTLWTPGVVARHGRCTSSSALGAWTLRCARSTARSNTKRADVASFRLHC